MKLFKEQLVMLEGWVLEIGGKQYPVAALKTAFYILFAVLAAALCYQIGQQNSIESFKYTAYMLANNGLCDESGTYCIACKPVAVINDRMSMTGHVEWKCEQPNETETGIFNLSVVLQNHKP